MRILVTGANGFIGRQIAAALRAAGHEVISAVRRSDGNGVPAAAGTVACDLAHDTAVADWLPRVQDMDAVVNCAGILRESRGQSFDAVHRAAPCALFDACVEAAVKRVVQISALGNGIDVPFIASKHAADDYLMSLRLDWTVVRPSVVYTTAGSYGGTSLMRALAAFPWVLAVPGSGAQRLQPITGEDLARVVLAAVEKDTCRRTMLEAVCPAPVTFREYLLALRRWLGFPEPLWCLRAPLWLVRPVAQWGEWLGSGPLGMTMYRMLQRGNVGSEGAYAHLVRMTGVETVTVGQAFATRPSFVQDRWHARLYPVRPLLRLLLAVVWVGSGIAGFVTPVEESRVLVTAMVLPAGAAPALVYAASTVDLVLGALLLCRRAVAPVGFAMLASLLIYTVVLGFTIPALWFEPLGGLLKNLALFPAVLAMLVLERIR